MKRFKKIIGLLLFAVVFIGTVIIVNDKVYAVKEETAIKWLSRKIDYSLLNDFCASEDNIEKTISTTTWNSYEDLFHTKRSVSDKYPTAWPASKNTCGELLQSYAGSLPSDDSGKGELLKQMGYKETGSGIGTKNCVKTKYAKHKVNLDGEGKVISYDPETAYGPEICAVTESDGKITYSATGSQDILKVTIVGTNITLITPLTNTNCPTIDGSKWADFVSGYNSCIKDYFNSINKNGDPYDYYDNPQTPSPTEEKQGTSTEYKLENSTSNAVSLIGKNIINVKNPNFEEHEKVSLYQWYLKQNSSSIVCDPTNEPNMAVAKKVKLVINGRYYLNCFAVEKNSGATKEHAVNGRYKYDQTVDYQGIIDYLNSVNITKKLDTILDPGATIGGDAGSGKDPASGLSQEEAAQQAQKSSDDAVCFDNAGALGWVACPVISSLNGVLSALYDTAENEFLQTNPEYIGEKIEPVWGTVRDFANIVFVIILLVVIFSQLTGFGIDNYGIKKILPRLIIAALLVNLSLFICRAAVDATNIIGVSLRQLLEQASGTIAPANPSGISTASGAVFTGTIIGVVVGTAVYANPAIILSFLVTLLSCVLAVMTLMVILVARQVGIIVIVIISPLAFVAYLLPNTSKLLGKWWSVLKGLLVAYPLCALMVGGGALVSNIVGSIGDDGITVFVGMLIRVLPFFAIPTLLRRSLDALGSLGATINNLGSRARQGAANGIRNSEGFRNIQQAGLERRNMIRSGLDAAGDERTGIRRIGTAIGRRARANARAQHLKDRETQQQIDQLNDNNYLRARRVEQDIKAEAQQNETMLINDPNYRRGMINQQQLDLEDKREKMRTLAGREYVTGMRNQQALKRRGEAEEIHRLNDPNFLAAMQANQDTQFEKKKTEAQAAALTAGNFTTTNGGPNVTDPSNLSQLHNALVHELQQNAGGADNIDKINALYDAIRAKGDKGIDALGNVFEGRMADGTTMVDLNANSAGFRKIMNNIANDGEIKKKSRTLHGTANDVQNGEKTYARGMVATARDRGDYAGSIKVENISDLTDNERAAYMNFARQAAMTDEGSRTRQQVAALDNVSRAMANNDVMKGMKTEERWQVEEINQIANLQAGTGQSMDMVRTTKNQDGSVTTERAKIWRSAGGQIRLSNATGNSAVTAQDLQGYKQVH